MKRLLLLVCLALCARGDVTIIPRPSFPVSASGVDNNVAHDAATEPATFTTTSPFTWTHTPVGTPKGVLVFIDHGTESTDLITGTVSYGGVSMTRVNSATDTATEPGRSYIYFLGSGIPTGAQTVSITHNGASTVKHAVSVTLTSNADTSSAANGTVNENAANPSVALNSSGDTALRYCVIYSGLGTVGSLTLLSGMSAVHDHDYGNFVSRVDRETTKSSGSFTIGYTSGSDDVAMCAVAIK